MFLGLQILAAVTRGDLFDLHPDNSFLVKLSYWINR